MAGASPAASYPETMRHRFAIVLTVIGAIALPIVMAATVLYASDAAIGGTAEPLKPQFATTAQPQGTSTTAHRRHDDRSGQNGGGASTGGGDDHGGSSGSGGSSGGGSSDGGSSGGSGSGSSGSGSSGGGSDGGSSGSSGGSSHGGGDDGSGGGHGDD